MTGDSEMRNSSNSVDADGFVDVEHYRKLVKQFIDMVSMQTLIEISTV